METQLPSPATRAIKAAKEIEKLAPKVKESTRAMVKELLEERCPGLALNLRHAVAEITEINTHNKPQPPHLTLLMRIPEEVSRKMQKAGILEQDPHHTRYKNITGIPDGIELKIDESQAAGKIKEIWLEGKITPEAHDKWYDSQFTTN